MHPTLDPTRVALNRAQRRAIDKRPGAVFVAVPPGSGLETGERFRVPRFRYADGHWSECEPGDETTLTAVVSNSPR